MFKDAKISTKVILGFAIAILLSLVIGLVGRQAMLKNYEVGHDLGAVAVPSLFGIEEMSTGMVVVANGQLGLSIRRLHDPKRRQENFDTIAKGLRQFAEGRRIYEPLPQQPDEARLWRQAVPLFDEWQRKVQHVVDMQQEKDKLLSQGQKQDDPAIVQLDDKSLDAVMGSRDTRLEAQKLVSEIVRINYDLTQKIVKDTAAATTHSSELIFLVILLGAAIAIALAVTITRGVNGTLTALRGESGRLTEAALAGQLDTRGDLMAVPSEFRSIIQGVNDTLDAVVGPLNVAADYVDKISKGNIPPTITETYRGDFNTLKNNLNECIHSLNGLLKSMASMHESQKSGDIEAFVDQSQFNGAYRQLAEGVNESVKVHISAVLAILEVLGAYSQGNFAPILKRFPGKQVIANERMDELRRSLLAVISEFETLSKAAVEGKLATRADASKHEGDFRKIVRGVNETLDAVISPLNVAADYVDKISKGKIPPRITDQYSGDFNTIKNNLNQCIDAVNLMVTDAQALSQAAVEGRLSTRADATKHVGDFRKIVEGVNKTLDAVIDPIVEATTVLEALSNYDLRARVKGNYNGDHARIKTALNDTGKALHDAMVQVAESVEQVSQASSQIASSSQSVAQGASEQASSLEETSASLEEMSGMTKQNADNTIQARTLAQSTKEAAEKGGTAMTRMIDAMEKIRSASEGTAEIIKDINEIAFQTNLLALNAAVEAARAGDAGRGFAVVAEEVRNLALRSKEAAKKTEDLIKMSVSHAANGRVISGEVAGSLTEIVSAAGKVNDIVSEIAIASQEQARGIEQVNKAVSEMDKVVQVSAANAEESSSAAEELSGQSDELTGLVARFQVERETARRISKREVLSPEVRRRVPTSLPVHRPQHGSQARSRTNGTNGSRKPTAEEVIPFDADPEFVDF